MVHHGFRFPRLAGALLVVSMGTMLLQHPMAAQTTPPQSAPGGGTQLAADTQAQLAQLRTRLQSAIAASDARTAAKILNQIGKLWLDAGNQQYALEAYNKALAGAKLAQDAEQGVAALNGLGTVAGLEGQPREAQQDFQRALEVATAQGVRGGQADALNGLALLSANQNQPEKALNFANQALAIRRAMGDRDGEATILGEIATGYGAYGDIQKAMEYGQLARNAFQAADDHLGEANALMGIGSILGSQRDKKCQDYFEQALVIAKQFNFPRIQAKALNLIGLVQDALGENVQALDSYTEALAIFQRFNMTDEAASVLSNMGMAYQSLGEMQEAIDSYSRALPMLQATDDRRGQAAALNNMGMVFQSLGDGEKAIDYYSQAVPILIGLDDRFTEAVALDNMGATYVELGDKKKAINILNKALALQTGMPNRDVEGLARVNLGVAYYKLGEMEKAIGFVNQGVDLLRQADDRQNEARAHTALAKAYWDMGDNVKALAELNQALPLARAVNDPLILAPILYGMMRLHKSQPTLAIFYGKNAVNLVQQVRSKMQSLDKGLQTTFVSSRAIFYHDLADLLIDQHRLPEAEEIIDLMKQQQLKEFTRDESKEATRPASLSPEEQKLEDAYEDATKDLMTSYEDWSTLDAKKNLTDSEKEELKKLDARVENGSRKFEELLDHLDTVLQAAEKQKLDRARDDIPGLADLVSKLDKDTVVLYTLVTEDRYRVIVIREGHALVERSAEIKSAELSRLVVQFVDLLSHPGETRQLTDVSAKLYNVLVLPIEPVLAQANAHTLVWELDDVLHYIPMAALYDPQTKQFLVQEYANAIITPTSVSMLDKTPDVKNSNLLAMGLSGQYDEHFSPLKNVPAELSSIVRDPKVAGTHGPVEGTEWLNNDFTVANLKEQLKSGRYQFVHLASHFDAQASGDATKSFLLTAGDESGGGSGFHLTLDALRHDPGFHMGSVELLTFSACKTAVAAKATDGHEVDGLAGVGHKLGAKAVMASLWEVDDSSTSKLMGDFYQRWAGPGGAVAKVEALRQAQLDLLLGKDRPRADSSTRGFGSTKAAQNVPEGYAHPYYWAPFVLMGNWR